MGLSEILSRVQNQRGALGRKWFMTTGLCTIRLGTVLPYRKMCTGAVVGSERLKHDLNERVPSFLDSKPQAHYLSIQSVCRIGDQSVVCVNWSAILDTRKDINNLCPCQITHSNYNIPAGFSWIRSPRSTVVETPSMSSSTRKRQQMPEIMPRQTMRGHTGSVYDVVHLPGGRRIITGSGDGSLRVWDLKSGAQIGEDWRDEGEESAVYSIALSPNGNTVASGSEDGTVKLWDVEKGKVIAKWTGHTSDVHWRDVLSVCWSADGERVLSGSYSGGVARVWDVKSGETVLVIKTGHQIVHVVTYSPDQSKITTGGYNENAVKIWDAKTGELLDTLEHENHVASLAWTSDGKKLISGSGPIRIFNTTTWQQIAILGGYRVGNISLFGNDRLLVSASYDIGTARLWNLDTNLPVGPPMQHGDWLPRTTFSVDGKLLVTGCLDKNAYVWDIHAILKEAGLEDLLTIPIVPAGKPLMNDDATRRPAQLKDPRRLPPGFFDDSSATRSIHPGSSTRHRAPAPSSANPRALLDRLSTLFRSSHYDTNEPTDLQQCPRQTLFSHRGLRVVEVPTVQDRRSLVVTRPRERRPSGPRPVTTFRAYLVLLLCCASPQMAERTQQQQGQSKDQDQALASSSQTQPAAASTSKAPPAHTIAPGAAGAGS